MGKLVGSFVGWSRFKDLFDNTSPALRKFNPVGCHVCHPARRAMCEQTKMCDEPTLSGTYWEEDYLKEHGIKPSSSGEVNRAKLAVIRKQEFKQCRCIKVRAQEVRKSRPKRRTR